jgi:hypothetical protein
VENLSLLQRELSFLYKQWRVEVMKVWKCWNNKNSRCLRWCSLNNNHCSIAIAKITCNNQENNFISSFFLKILHFIFFYKSKFIRIVISFSKFLYNHIFTQFGYNIVTNQGAHFINDTIHYLTNHFILKHINSTIYYR